MQQEAPKACNDALKSLTHSTVHNTPLVSLQTDGVTNLQAEETALDDAHLYGQVYVDLCNPHHRVETTI